MGMGYIIYVRRQCRFRLIQRGYTMCPYDAREALIFANLTPVDRAGGLLLQAVQNIEEGSRNRRVLRLMFKACDEAVVRWFKQAVRITHTQNAMFDEELVNIARYIVNNERLAEKAEHDEIVEAIILRARNAVTMADMHGDASCWWYTC